LIYARGAKISDATCAAREDRPPLRSASIASASQPDCGAVEVDSGAYAAAVFRVSRRLFQRELRALAHRILANPSPGRLTPRRAAK